MDVVKSPAISTFNSAMPVPREILDRFYVRVMGFAYQVLGDAELAARATEEVFVRREPPADEAAVWAATIEVLRRFLARGFMVRPLVPQTQGWQAELLHGLARLAPMDRALLLLRYHEGVTIEALARILVIDEREARRRIAQARAKLIDELYAP